ncbi:MAG: PucR family transcriptional regulator [Christensenellales bacterium]
MKTKDKLKDVFESEESFGGCNINDKSCLIESLINRVPIKDILAYRNLLIDANFKSIMEDEELARCVEEFFKYDLNVAETSRKSYLHRNTLLYRIEKIANLTGLNIRSFDDAVTVRILMIIYNLTK